MKPLSESLKVYSFPKERMRGTERGEIVDMFLNQVNADRQLHGLQIVVRSALDFLFRKRGMTINILWSFYRECEKAENFGKHFWWGMKEKFPELMKPTGLTSKYGKARI